MMNRKKLINKIVILAVAYTFTACQNIDTSKRPVPDVGNQGSIEAKYINRDNCDQIINKDFFKICYSYKYKAAKSVAYILDGDLVNDVNIEERPRFYPENAIDDPYRAYVQDYHNSGYDRGHLAPDAAFDWSEESLESTYSLANIIPQDGDVNQHQWVKVEEHARKEAVILGKINVINLVVYPEHPKVIGADKIAVSKGYYKIMYNKEKNYKECFYYDNNASLNANTLYGNSIDCKRVFPK